MKPHVPLIKFRKSSANPGGKMASAPASPAMATAPQRIVQSAATSPTKGKSNATTALPIIEDWQLPQRYRRREIDPAEIDYINRGGRE